MSRPHAVYTSEESVAFSAICKIISEKLNGWQLILSALSPVIKSSYQFSILADPTLHFTSFS